MIALGAAAMAVAFGSELPGTIVDLIQEKVETFIIPSHRENRPPKEWAIKIFNLREELMNSDIEDLQDAALQICQSSLFYGTHWFYVYKIDSPPAAKISPTIKYLPREIMLGFNSLGLFITTWERQVLASFSYADIYRWGGSASKFTIVLNDVALDESFEFAVITSQSADLAAIMLDHIRALMAALEASLGEEMNAVDKKDKGKSAGYMLDTMVSKRHL